MSRVTEDESLTIPSVLGLGLTVSWKRSCVPSQCQMTGGARDKAETFKFAAVQIKLQLNCIRFGFGPENYTFRCRPIPTLSGNWMIY